MHTEWASRTNPGRLHVSWVYDWKERSVAVAISLTWAWAHVSDTAGKYVSTCVKKTNVITGNLLITWTCKPVLKVMALLLVVDQKPISKYSSNEGRFDGLKTIKQWMELELGEKISLWQSEHELQFILPAPQSCPPDLLLFLSYPLIGGWPQGQAGCSGGGTEAEERGRWQADPGKSMLDLTRH